MSGWVGGWGGSGMGGGMGVGVRWDQLEGICLPYSSEARESSVGRLPPSKSGCFNVVCAAADEGRVENKSPNNPPSRLAADGAVGDTRGASMSPNSPPLDAVRVVPSSSSLSTVTPHTQELSYEQRHVG